MMKKPYQNKQERLHDQWPTYSFSPKAYSHTTQIFHLLEYAEVNQELFYNQFSDKQKAQYNKLKEGMMAATHPEELRFYEQKIVALIKKVDDFPKGKNERKQ